MEPWEEMEPEVLAHIKQQVPEGSDVWKLCRATETLHSLRSGQEVILPSSKDHAEAMVLVGYKWLDDHGFNPNVAEKNDG